MSSEIKKIKIKADARTQSAAKVCASPSDSLVTVVTGSALPASAAELMRDIASDPKKARAFLMRAGIITKSGKLAPEYT